MIKRIAIIGPESTGKSTLSIQLGIEFQEPVVEEYGRTYLEKYGPDYDKSDLESISKGIINSEEKASLKASEFIICDTDLIMMQVWYEEKYQEVPDFLLNSLKHNPYHYYLICYPDLEWQADPLRENPHNREYLFNRYRELVESCGIPFKIIKGGNRWYQAAGAIKRFTLEA